MDDDQDDSSYAFWHLQAPRVWARTAHDRAMLIHGGGRCPQPGAFPGVGGPRCEQCQTLIDETLLVLWRAHHTRVARRRTPGSAPTPAWGRPDQQVAA